VLVIPEAGYGKTTLLADFARRTRVPFTSFVTRIASTRGFGRSYDDAMPTWRCPHCGTPQAESSRCWVCQRSSTSCGTCRHFRHSIAAQIGFCGLDRQRRALRGDEIRGCWEAATFEAEPGGGGREAATGAGSARTDVRRHIEFVPIDGIRTPPPAPSTPAGTPESPAPRTGPRFGLWAEFEP
jgi:hypothetical protein